MERTIPTQTDNMENTTNEEDTNIPQFGTREWIQYWAEFEGHLPTPINVSITDSMRYKCPQLKWYNFSMYPHKVKLTNTGYTLIVSSKWKTERPFLMGGPFLEKHVISQIHFHWGADMMEGSDHTVDEQRHPGEMQVVFFRSEYLTQEEALRHPDGVTMICYLIKYGVNDDKRLSWVIEGFKRVREAKTSTKIGPYPMSRLLPMFFEDYFLYWGNLKTVKGENFVVKWLVSRKTLYASFEQMDEFRKLWDPWDEPNLRNYRPLQERRERHVFFIQPHWNQYNSLLPIPRIPDPSYSVLSNAYRKNPWMLPPQNKREQISRLFTSQSPIIITSNLCPIWSSFDPLYFEGYRNQELIGTLLNSGQTAYLTIDSDRRPTLRGGPFVKKYIFEQMHFHWSNEDFSGCEHVLDGQKYAAECHIVHYKGVYKNKDEAVNHPDGLAVVGIFLEAVDNPNPGFNRLVSEFEKIKTSADSIKTTAESLAWMNLDELQEGNYVTYKGSLTTPPFTECVTWILYEKPVRIGHKQLAMLRQLEGPDSVPINRNIRATQNQPPGDSIIFVKQVARSVI